MSKKYSDILSFFINCVESENLESFSLPRNEKRIFDLSEHLPKIEDLLNGDEKYLEILGPSHLQKFIEYRNKYRPNDKIFLAVDLIPKRDRSGESLLPIYITEVLVEEFNKSKDNRENRQTIIRVSTVDLQPTFNHVLLQKEMTIHDRFLLMDEIFEELDWAAKKQLYLNHIEDAFVRSITTKPVLFLSSALHSVQSSVSLELAWINRKFLSDIPKTSLLYIFDRILGNNSEGSAKQKYLEIFPLNKVQRDVVRFALDNPFTVITGPPGTGKSQVVLNLLANIYVNGKTVLFASKNNKAVNTVIEKFELIQSGYCPFIRLGNKKEKQIGLQKVISGIEESDINCEQTDNFYETKQLTQEIDQLYLKLKKSDDQFKEYCDTVKSIANKTKEIPTHLQTNIYNGLLLDVEKFENSCLKLSGNIETCNHDFLKNRKKILSFKKKIKECKQSLLQFEKELETLHLRREGNHNYPEINKRTITELKEFIEQIEKQQSENKIIENQINEKNELLTKLRHKTEIIRSDFENFIKSGFDPDLKSLIEKRLSDISQKIGVSFFELNQQKADVEKYITIKDRPIRRLLFSISRPFFKRKSYRRFKSFLDEQPDFLSRYALSKTENLDLVTLYEVISILTKIPKCVEYFENLTLQYHEIKTFEQAKRELQKCFELKNFYWIEESLKDFIKISFYKIDKNDFKNHIELLETCHQISIEIKNLFNKITEIKEIQCQIKILHPKTKINYYDGLFDEIDRFLLGSSMHTEPMFKVDKMTHDFDVYRELLNESKNILKNLKNLKSIYEKSESLKRLIQMETSNIQIELVISNKQKILVDKSIALFNNHLSKNISKNIPEFKQIVTDYFENWKDVVLHKLYRSLIQYMGIFVTTNLSTRYNIPNMPALFDYVIIDEASQNDIASVLPLLFRAKRTVVLGDPNQLKHISHLKNYLVDKFADSCQIGPALLDYHYIKKSAYDLCAKAFQECSKKSPFILRNHYRCHPEIIQFSNYEFYKSKLFPKTYMQRDISPLEPGVYWRSVQGNYKDHSNPNEAENIVAFIEELRRKGLNKNVSIGIITPFRNQKNLLLKLLSRKKLISGKISDRIQASTVHSFQGDERDIIIYSPVLSTGINKPTQEWLDRSTDLLNVAITRARNALIVFGDTNYCLQTSGIHKKLLRYCMNANESKGLPDFDSPSEQIFFNALEEAGINFDYQVPVGRYIADFILKQGDNFLCIELDGYQHNQTKSYDYSRNRYFEDIGYNVLRIPTDYAERYASEISSLLKNVCVSN